MDEIDLTDSKSLGKSITTEILEDQPSCLEFSRCFPNLFVLGTYHLDTSSDGSKGQLSGGEQPSNGEESAKKTQTRTGSLRLYSLRPDCTM